MAVLLVAVVQTPIQVAASTSTFSEDFDDTTFMDGDATTVTGWGSEEIRIPFKTATSVGHASDTTYCTRKAVIDGDYLYLPSPSLGVGVVDISDPLNPFNVTTLDSSPYAIAIQGDFAYISGAGLRIINISDILNPVEVATYNPGAASHFTVDGSIGYLSTLGQGIHVLNISNPLIPVSISNYTHVNATNVFETKKVGNMLVVGEFGVPGSQYGVQIVNATDPTNLVYWSRITTMTNYQGVQLEVVGDYIYVANTGGYISITEILTSNWNLGYANLIYAGAVGHSGRMVVSGNYIYGAGGSYGFHMIDVTDPSNPRLDIIKMDTSPNWIAMDGNYVFTNGESAYSVEVYELSDALTATAQSSPVYQISPGAIYETSLPAMITEATLTADSTIPGSTSIEYYLSADNGSTWELVDSGVNHEFGVIGQDLLWKAVLTTTSPTVTPEIYTIDISFKFLRTPPELVQISYTNGYNSPFFEFDKDDSDVVMQLDTVQTFDSPNFRNFTGYHYSGLVTGYGVHVKHPDLTNGTWYYRIAGIDYDGDIGLWSDVGTLQIGTTSTTTPPDLILILVIGGAIGVVAIIVLVILYKKRS